MKSIPYLPRLDGLRGIAIVGVLLEHFFPSTIVHDLSPGGFGVTLFFVLSGYLITRILLGYQQKGVSVLSAARHFYFRRILRLSPPYYLTIAVGALLGLKGLDHHWWIHALYLTNFQVALHGAWPGETDQFWSLAVEEQFYIFWFFVVLLVPIRHCIWVIVCAFLIAIAFRIAIYCFHLSAVTAVLLPGQLASLGTGALLAYTGILPNLARVTGFFCDLRVLVVSGLLFTLASVSLKYWALAQIVLYPFLGALFSGCLVCLCVNPGSAFLAWLGWGPLRFLGKISYGIYVYHGLVYPVIGRFLGANEWVVFVALSTISIGGAAVSWYILEHPILRFKDRIVIK